MNHRLKVFAFLNDWLVKVSVHDLCGAGCEAAAGRASDKWRPDIAHYPQHWTFLPETGEPDQTRPHTEDRLTRVDIFTRLHIRGHTPRRFLPSQGVCSDSD